MNQSSPMLRVYSVSLIYGFLGGCIAGFTSGVVLSLTSGLPARPATLAFGLTGMLVAALMTYNKNKAFQFVSFGVAIVFASLLSGLQPFALPLSESSLWQGMMLALFAFGVVTSLAYGCEPLNPQQANRYLIEDSLIRMLRVLGFVFFGAIIIIPFYILVMTSMKSQQMLLLNPLDLSPDFSKGLGQIFFSYHELFSQFNFGTYLLNSTLVSTGTVIVTLTLAIPGAYAVARLNFPGQRFLSRSILLIYMVPAIVLVIPLYTVFSKLGLRDSLVGLLIVYPATTLPVALYMLRGYFAGIPKDLEEAGQMDGLPRMSIILQITLPLSLPALASVGIYVFMIAWNEFLFAFMFLDDPNFFTLSRGVVSLNSSEVPRQHLMAGAMIATIPVLVLFLWAERLLVQGLTAGGVKG